MSGRKGLTRREPRTKPRPTMAWRDWVKGGARTGPSIATTKELLAVSRPARNTPARKIAAMRLMTAGWRKWGHFT